MGQQHGFTLIELMLSIVIISMITGLSLPVYNSFAVRNDLDVTTEQVVQALRRAQTYARGMEDDVSWSINVSSTTVTLYKGSPFTGHDASGDETISLPASVTPSGITDTTFTKFTGIPTTTGSITLTSTANHSRTITINAKGMVNYN